jgi:pSer/pThr/pTyr-binding forkhead associated (FHA) protein
VPTGTEWAASSVRLLSCAWSIAVVDGLQSQDGTLVAVDGRALERRCIKVTEPGRTPLHLLVVAPLEIGRAGIGLVLCDPGISRRHLVVEPVEDGIVVRDVGSSNGTTVDGARLERPRLLERGQVVRFGACSLELGAFASPMQTRTGMSESGRTTSVDTVAAAVLADRSGSVREHDAGTITIVFTDIERSTSRAVEVGDLRWMQTLSAHNTLIRTWVARFGGREVKAQGDGFMLSFPSASRALACMIEVQRALSAFGQSRPAAAVTGARDPRAAW